MATKFISYLNEVLKDMDKAEKGNRTRASKIVLAEILKRLSTASHLSGVRERARKLGVAAFAAAKTAIVPGPPGSVTGNLFSGMEKYDGKEKSFVGAMAPAYHAHLLEFGTKNAPAYPVIYPSFEAKENEIKEELSKPIA